MMRNQTFRKGFHNIEDICHHTKLTAPLQPKSQKTCWLKGGKVFPGKTGKRFNGWRIILRTRLELEDLCYFLKQNEGIVLAY